MPVFDASSMIYAWDNYPLRQFPGLWKWMATQVGNEALIMPDVAFTEVKSKTPDCWEWLKNENLKKLEANNAIVDQAMRIKGLLGIVEDNYHAKGVGENDLIIIATARIYKAELVSDESLQSALPQHRSKWKIPAVCSMNGVDVTCVNFIDYIKRSEVVFR